MMESEIIKIEPERPIKKFLNDVIACLTEPRRFFTDRFPQYTLNQALLFAVIVSWFSSFLEWMTRAVRHETLLDGFLKIRDQLESLPMWKGITPHLFADTDSLNMIPGWTMELASVALNPFKTLFSLMFAAVFVWVGAIVLVSKKDDQDPIDYPHILKLIAVATTAPKLIGAILGFLPLGLGTLVTLIYVLFLEVFALTIRYKVSGLRGLAIIILPSFILSIMAACVFGLIAVILFGIFGALFK